MTIICARNLVVTFPEPQISRHKSQIEISANGRSRWRAEERFLCGSWGRRYRRRNSARAASQNLRSLFHRQAGQKRHRARALHHQESRRRPQRFNQNGQYDRRLDCLHHSSAALKELIEGRLRPVYVELDDVEPVPPNYLSRSQHFVLLNACPISSRQFS